MREASPPQKSYLPWVLGGLAAAGLLGLLCCGVPLVLVGVMGVGMRQAKDDEQRKIREQPAIEVSASELVAAYRENAASANTKYKDKVVQVTGVVEKIDERYLTLEGQRGFVGKGFDLLRVHVYFNDQDKGKMSTLSKGQSITVRGKFTGKGWGDALEVKECLLVK